MPPIVLGLWIDPAFCSGIKGNRNTNRHLRTDAGPSIQYSGKCLSAYPQSLLDRDDVENAREADFDERFGLAVIRRAPSDDDFGFNRLTVFLALNDTAREDDVCLSIARRSEADMR